MKLLSAAIAATLVLTSAAALQAAPEGAVDRTAVDRTKARETAFNRMDTNKDGSLSREEMNAAATRRAARLDADKDGKVSRAEFVSVGKATAKREARFTKLDKAGVGTLPLERFVAVHLRRLDRMDANKDGVISRAEYVSFRPKKAG